MSYEPTVMRRALARLERRRDHRERRRFELERKLYAEEPRLGQADARGGGRPGNFLYPGAG